MTKFGVATALVAALALAAPTAQARPVATAVGAHPPARLLPAWLPLHIMWPRNVSLLELACCRLAKPV